jgi:hypothetical protein
MMQRIARINLARESTPGILSKLHANLQLPMLEVISDTLDRFLRMLGTQETILTHVDQPQNPSE